MASASRRRRCSQQRPKVTHRRLVARPVGVGDQRRVRPSRQAPPPKSREPQASARVARASVRAFRSPVGVGHTARALGHANRYPAPQGSASQRDRSDSRSQDRPRAGPVGRRPTCPSTCVSWLRESASTAWRRNSSRFCSSCSPSRHVRSAAHVHVSRSFSCAGDFLYLPPLGPVRVVEHPVSSRRKDIVAVAVMRVRRRRKGERSEGDSDSEGHAAD